MNAMMNIMVRVDARAAMAQMKAMEAQTRTSATNVNKAGGLMASGLANGLHKMTAVGKNLQWTGRQLEYNITLPLLLAGGAATKWALDNERAMTRVKKVYGDVADSPAMLNAELTALATTFELLSTRYGVHQDEVIDIGSAWAQAGAAGVALAKATRMTLDMMILGDMEATVAMQGLLAVQSAYRLDTEELRIAMAKLNATENTTGITMQGLIEVITRAGGSARAAGIEINELAGFAAILVPAAGSASQAGNSLRTMFSRLLAPTTEAKNLLQEIGINVTDVGWTSMTGTQRIQELSTAFADLTQDQKAQVAATVASRWQINRFQLVMEDLNLFLTEGSESLSTYGKVMRATADDTVVMATMQRELAAVLESNPKAFDIAWNAIRNGMARAIAPMLPMITAAIAKIAQMVKAFSELDPNTQRWIMTLLLMLALFGPIMKYFGVLYTFIAQIGWILLHTARAFVLFGTIGVKAVGLLVKGWGLFLGFWKALWLAVVGVKTAAMLAMSHAAKAGFGAIMTMTAGFSAGMHAILASPWVLAGAAIIAFIVIFRNQIAGMLGWVVDAFNRLPAAIRAPFVAIANFIANVITKIREWLSYLNPFARHSPSLVDNVVRGVATILDQYSKLTRIAGVIRGAATAQLAFAQAVSTSARTLQDLEFAEQKGNVLSVSPGAGAAFDQMVSSIRELQYSLGIVGVEIARQKDLVIPWAAALEAALKPFNDAIFENEMAQKALRLEILRLEDAGQSIDDIRNKYAELSGEIENLMGEREDLRLAGAGADILKTYDDQIAGLDAQRNAMEGMKSPIAELEKQLADLQRQGEIMDLERALAFDPQLAALEAEEAKLRQLEDAYGDIESEIGNMEQALNSAAQVGSDMLSRVEETARATKEAAEAAASAASAAAGGGADSAMSDFAAAGLGDYETPEGTAVPGLGREGGLPEIEQFNEDLQKELDDALQKMGDFDLFKPFREAWDKAWIWLEDNVGKPLSEWWNNLSFGAGNPFEGIAQSVSEFFSMIMDSPVGDLIRAIIEQFEHLGYIVQRTWDDVIWPVIEWIGEKVGDLVSAVSDELKNWEPLFEKTGNLFSGLGEALGFAIEWIARLLGFLGQVLKVGFEVVLNIWGIVWNALKHPLDAIWNAIIAIVVGAIQFIRGIFEFFFALITGDWAGMWQGLMTMLDAVWGIIWGIIKGGFDLIVGIIRGAIEIVVGIFQWLYDMLVGNSIVPDLINGIVALFQFLFDVGKAIWQAIADAIVWVWENIIMPIWDAIKWYIENILVPVFQFLWDIIMIVWDGIKAAIEIAWSIIQAIWNAIKWYIDNVLIPVFNFLWNIIQAVWEGIKSAITIAWNIIQGIWNAIKWYIETVLVPIFNFIWNTVSDVFNWIKDKIETVIRTVTGVFQGIVDFIQDKVISKFETLKETVGNVFQNIKDTASDVFGKIGDIMKDGINLGIRAVNKLIDGLNAVARLLPFIDFEISPIGEMMAAGGRVPGSARPVGNGLVTNRARAIVGEGNPLYPEYVIPTDPTYRNRANGLFRSLGDHLGIPTFATGGVTGTIEAGKEVGGGFFDAVGNFIGTVRKGAAIALFNPVNDFAKDMINKIEWDWIRDRAHSFRETAYNWVVGEDNKLPEVPALAEGIGWEAMWKAVSTVFPWAQLFSAVRPGAITINGTPSDHGFGRAIDITPSMEIFDWIASNYGNSKSVIFSPANGRQIYRGSQHNYTEPVRGQHWDHIHWAMAQGGLIPIEYFMQGYDRNSNKYQEYANGGLLKMASGGAIVGRRSGGVMALLGEGRNDEEVQVRPINSKEDKSRQISFYGDLSFPNITDPNDAETFIRNLETLAGE